MPELADRWHLIAPDYPGFGYSGTPEQTRFTYTFDGYADFLYRFVKALNLNRYTCICTTMARRSVCGWR